MFQLGELNILGSERRRCLTASLRGSDLLALPHLSLEEKPQPAAGRALPNAPGAASLWHGDGKGEEEAEVGGSKEPCSCRCISASAEEVGQTRPDPGETEL